MSCQVRQARTGLSIILFLTGLIFASWAARIPAIKDGAGLGDGGLAAVLLAEHAGSVVGLQVGALIVPRLGSRTTLRVFLPAFAGGLILLALVWDIRGLSVCLVLFGVVNSVVDVAINSHSAVIEARSRQPVFSRLHALHSAGAIAGAGGGALAAHANLAVWMHFLLVAAICGAGSAGAGRMLLPSTVDRSSAVSQPPKAAPKRRPTLRTPVLVLGLLAFCCTLAEGVVGDWSSVFLRDEAGASPAVAALGYGVFVVLMAAGRLTGDRLRERYGAANAFRGAALVAGAGLVVVVVGRSPLVGLVGFAILGAGLSYTLPVILAAASRIPGHSPATAVARVSTIGYLGFSVGPGLIGVCAQFIGLTAALGVPAVLIAATAVAARAVSAADGVVQPRPAAPASEQRPDGGTTSAAQLTKSH